MPEERPAGTPELDPRVDPGFLAQFELLAGDPVCVTDERGTFVHVNDAFAALLGLTPNEIIGRSFTEFLHPEDVTASKGAHEERMDDTEPVENPPPRDGSKNPLINRYRAKDGTYRSLLWSSAGLLHNGLLYAPARDVTNLATRGQEQDALSAAWLVVSTQRSLEATLRAVNEQARRLARARQAVTSLTVGDAWNQAVTAVELDEHYQQWRDFETPPTGTGIYTEVVRTGRPMRLTQAELVNHPLWQGFGAAAHEHPPMRGWLAVPLPSRDGSALGLIQVSDREDGSDFTAEDEDLLVQFARIAALTVERAQAEETATDALTQVREMLGSISDAFFAVDSAWHITYVNPAAQLMLGQGADVIGSTLWEVFPASEGTRLQRELARAVRDGEHVSFREHHADRKTWYDVRAFPYGSGLAVYFIDASERVAAADELERRAAMQAVVADIGQIALSGTDIDVLLAEAVERVANVLVVGTSIGRLVDGGLTLEGCAAAKRDSLETQAVPIPIPATCSQRPLTDFVGTAWAATMQTNDWAVVDYLDPDERPAVAALFGFRSEGAVRIGRPEATWGILSCGHSEPHRFGPREGVFLTQVAHILASAIERDATERAVLHTATHDALTGLPNRKLLRDRLEDALHRTDAGNIALLLLDLDGFKDVNDSLGHATGDVILGDVADRLRTLLAADVTVARLGGDEFAVLVENVTDDDSATAVAKRVVDAIAIPFTLSELDIPLSASVGVVRAPRDGTDASTLLRRADVAMYRAKAHTLGWALYDEKLDAAQADRLQLITDLRTAIKTDQLELHYQPIIDMRTGAVVSVEALVRWRHPIDGLVPPLSFIPLAEQTGLIVPLTAWVIDEALRQSELWHAAGFRARIAVNISVDVLTSNVMSEALLERLLAASDRITAEITESSLADERARKAVSRLAAAGVSCAVDDFGTGYSSLAYLKDLPVSQLKIDRAFVKDVARTGRDMAIVRSVAELGNALSLEVVAEGVEDQASAIALQECGVRMAQGYLYARPVAGPAFTEWLTARAGAMRG